MSVIALQLKNLLSRTRQVLVPSADLNIWPRLKASRALQEVSRAETTLRWRWYGLANLNSAEPLKTELDKKMGPLLQRAEFSPSTPISAVLDPVGSVVLDEQLNGDRRKQDARKGQAPPARDEC